MATLLSQPHVTIERCTVLNPASLLPTAEDGTPHDCLSESTKRTLPRPDLKDIELPGSKVLFVDGSSKKNPNGTNATGYAVVDSHKVLKSGPLPRHYSAQAVELVALTEACKLSKGQVVTIYTDSQYAFSTTHVFAQMWKNRGMITSTGKPVNHAALLQDLLNAIQLPKQLAICKCAAHTDKSDPISLGNARADEAAKAASQLTDTRCR